MDIINEGESKGSTIDDDSGPVRLLLETTGGEKIVTSGRTLIVHLPDGRRTISTSWLNGGIRDDLRAIFNQQLGNDPEDLGGRSVDEYLAEKARCVNLDPKDSTGLLTSASMKNASVRTMSFRDLEVTAIVTAGIDVNGGRAGDPASYYQEGGRFEKIGGTINSILLIDADLPPYALPRAVMTATEAKTCALQRLAAPSRYSSGFATGSGTDMIAISSNRKSGLKLTDAGKHSKLGELIGNTIIEAITEALDRQSSLNPITQRDVMIRLERYSIDEHDIWDAASRLDGENRRAKFKENLSFVSKNPVMVAATGSILHICDEVSWGLVPENSGKRAALSIMSGVGRYVCPSSSMPINNLIDEKSSILENWSRTIGWIAKNGKMGDGR